MRIKNEKLLIKKITDYIASTGDQKIISEASTVAKQAGEKFIDCFNESIGDYAGSNYKNGALGSGAIDVLKSLSVKDVSRIPGTLRFNVEINFTGDLHRDSLDPIQYSGINNIASLLNNGYTASDFVTGVWHRSNGDNKYILSLKTRAGAHFMQDIAGKFFREYRSRFDKLRIKISNIYK